MVSTLKLGCKTFLGPDSTDNRSILHILWIIECKIALAIKKQGEGDYWFFVAVLPSERSSENYPEN